MPERLVRTYSVTELERMAHDYVTRHLGSAIPIPIDVDHLVEQAEGLDLDYYPKLQANHGVLGGVWRDIDSGGIYIFIDQDLADDDRPNSWARYRMTVAEELAHLQLHRVLIEGVASPGDFKALHSHAQWDEIERNAKRFAAAILMPSSALARESARVYEEIVGQPTIRSQLHKDGASTQWLEPIQKWLCDALAKRFEVSNLSMTHRLTEWPAKIAERLERSLEMDSDTLL